MLKFVYYIGHAMECINHTSTKMPSLILIKYSISAFGWNNSTALKEKNEQKSKKWREERRQKSEEKKRWTVKGGDLKVVDTENRM